MTFTSMYYLISILIFILLLIIGVFIHTRKSKNIKTDITLILLLFSLFVFLFVFSNVVTYSNGIKIDKTGSTINEYSVYKDESYVTTIKAIGPIKIQEQESDVLNKKIKITRNLTEGTIITLPQDEANKLKEYLSENERTK